jgi:hypothetical protein
MKKTGLMLVLVIATAAASAGARANGSPYSPGLDGWEGAVASNGAVRFVTLWAGGRTNVAKIQVRTGRVVGSRLVRGQYGVPIVTYDGTTGGISGDGRTLVIASYGPLPGSPGTTRFLPLDTKTLKPGRAVELEGSWSYDAISPDGKRLYLIEHLAPAPSPRYRVRVFDLVAGRLLQQSVIDKAASEAIMRGEPATRATSADGRWAYTLYARRKHAPFVHALDTARRQAYCIDLPLDLGRAAQMGLRLRLRAGDRELVVRRAGAVASVMNTETFVVHRH